MRKQTFNVIKNLIMNTEDNGWCEYFNFEDNMMYIFHNNQDVIQDINALLLEEYPSYAGMIDYGATKGLEVTMSGSRPRYYASIPIYPKGKEND